MATTKTQPEAVQPSALELELSNVDEVLRAILPPGVRLAIGGEALEGATIAAELRDWIQMFAAHAEAERRHAEREAEWGRLARVAGDFARAVKEALGRYLDGGPGACAGGREPPKRKCLAAAKLGPTRQLREAAGSRNPKGSIPPGELPWVE